MHNLPFSNLQKKLRKMPKFQFYSNPFSPLLKKMYVLFDFLISLIVSSQISSISSWDAQLVDRNLSLNNTELYSAMVHLEKLLSLPGRIATLLRECHNEEQNRLAELRHLSEQFAQLDSAARMQPSFLGNPVNSFKLIKQLVVDWKRVEQLIENKRSLSILELINRSVFPQIEDYKGRFWICINLESKDLL